MSASSVKFRVAICGGGIGGLTLAVALLRHPDIEIEIYEKLSAFEAIGAGVTFWKRTWLVMGELGLQEELARVAHEPPSEEPKKASSWRQSNQKDGWTFHEMIAPYGAIHSHRADFVQLLASRIPRDLVHFLTDLTSYENISQPDGRPHVKMNFADGTSRTCDILVGCDGIKSPTRAGMFADESEKQYRTAFWTGTVAYRGLVPRDVLVKTPGEHLVLSGHLVCFGKNQHGICYPVSQGQQINVIAYVTQPEKLGTPYPRGEWLSKCTTDEVVSYFRGWEQEFTSLVENILNPTLWAINELVPLPTYTRGRVALLGDAAHAMTPHIGSGAGQSIEDAFTLATILADPTVTLENVEIALQTYSDFRKPRAKKVADHSRAAGQIYEMRAPGFESMLDSNGQIIPEPVSDAVMEQWAVIWAADPIEDVKSALSLLEERLAKAV